MIEFKNISKKFTSLNGETTILSNASFCLPNNGFVNLSGKSGTGKTTILNMVAGLDLNFEGDILYDGINLKDLNRKEKDKFTNENIFYLKSRDNFIKNIKVSEVIYIYLLENQREKALELFNKFKLEYVLDKKIKKLSSGEIQKVSIIIAVCKNARITLLDEPICNIDDQSVKLFLDLIKELSNSSLVIYISHYDDDFDSYYSDILLLEHGKITCNKSIATSGNINDNKCISKFNFKKSLILERSKPPALYVLFRLIICIIACFVIYVSKLKNVNIPSVYSSSVSDMSVNLVDTRKNTKSELLSKKRIYYSPSDHTLDIYYHLSMYTDPISVGKASDFIFSGFNGTLKDNEIIISDYLAHEKEVKIGDTISLTKNKYTGEEVAAYSEYVIKHIYNTNYATYISKNEKIPEEYSYLYVSDSEIDEMINDSLYSFAGIYLNDFFYVSAYDSKFVECNHYDNTGHNVNYREPEDDEFYADRLGLWSLGLNSIISDDEFIRGTGDTYYDVTFTYNGLSFTKKMRYRKFVCDNKSIVVSKNFLEELKNYFGITSDNVLNYKEVTTLDTKSSNVKSYFEDFKSFYDMTFVNDNILRLKYSNINTLNTFYSENFIYILLFLAIFLILGLVRIVQIEYEYAKLLKSKNFSFKSRLGLFLSSKILVYLVVKIIIIILSQLIVAV